MNFDTNNQIANSCDWFGHIDSPKIKLFGCDLALYFCPLVLGHPVVVIILSIFYSEGSHPKKSDSNAFLVDFVPILIQC